MPWTVKDVDSKKKGLTPAQKKKWVKIANGVLKDCQAKKGKNCEGKAIKIANSKFGERTMALKQKEEKVPKGALRFVEEGFHALAIKDGDNPPKMRMTAYNGKVIKGHWYWGDLAIDLAGIKFSAGKFPILENHDTNRKIAFHKGKPDTSEGKLELIPEKTVLVDTEFANEFIKLSSDGFPYQASIYARPTEIQRLMKDETAEVNGFTLRGPGTVWRKCDFQEASICVFGWDSSTKSSAFSRETTEDVEYTENALEETQFAVTEGDEFNMEGGEIMNLDELKTKHPDLVEQLTTEVTDNVTTSLNKEFDKEREKFTEEKTALESKIEDSENRLAGLEKKDALREGREREAQADRIWDSKLSNSDIEESMFDKVKRMVSFKKFVKDDVLDIEAFSAAIDEEIKDWEGKLTNQSTSGLGSVGRTAEGDETPPAQAEENTKLTNDLLSRSGQEVTA
jgi:uncharacterized protein YdaT